MWWCRGVSVLGLGWITVVFRVVLLTRRNFDRSKLDGYDSSKLEGYFLTLFGLSCVLGCGLLLVRIGDLRDKCCLVRALAADLQESSLACVVACRFHPLMAADMNEVPWLHCVQ